MIHEAFADYWAMSSFAAQSARNYFDIACWGEWYAAGTCERSLASTVAIPAMGTLRNDAHDRSQVWSSVLLQIFTECRDEDVVDTLIVLSHVGGHGLVAEPTFDYFAGRMVALDRAMYGGAHQALLCSVFRQHGLPTLPGECVTGGAGVSPQPPR